jgi:hypothetical protein
MLYGTQHLTPMMGGVVSYHIGKRASSHRWLL